MAHDHGQHCKCVIKHVPKPMELHKHHVWPISEGGPDSPHNLLWLCPTTHTNVHELWREYDKMNGRPSWATLMKYSAYCRMIVERGRELRRIATNPTHTNPTTG